MTDELKSLLEDIEEATEKASMCCGCNMFAIDNAIGALKEYLKGAFKCENSYHSTDLGDCCNNYIGDGAVKDDG